jgi:transposase
MRDRWIGLDAQMTKFDKEFAAYARDDAGTRRLLTVPGIGALNATALVAAIGAARTFEPCCSCFVY